METAWTHLQGLSAPQVGGPNDGKGANLEVPVNDVLEILDRCAHREKRHQSY